MCPIDFLSFQAALVYTQLESRSPFFLHSLQYLLPSIQFLSRLPFSSKVCHALLETRKLQNLCSNICFLLLLDQDILFRIRKMATIGISR
ncbi:hypothetical protein PENTCL1PPCAC_704, partial [Pristionchus entomophagus]